MTNSLQTLLLIVITTTVLSGCGGGHDPLMPPKIYYGEDVCIQCSMIISDERYAAAMNVQADGRAVSRLFDDVGDMLDYIAAHQEEIIVASFVHDHGSHDWIDALTAMYLHSPALYTPMASGVGAFATTAEADGALARLGGQTLNWTQLKALHAQGELFLPQVGQGG